jgi:hypothetical protein
VVCLLAASFLGVAGVPASAASPAASSAVPATAAAGEPRAAADWILAAQLPDGSIASHVDRTFVNPYLSGFAAIGLASASRATADPAYAEAAWRAVEWHASRMDAQGYVTDYRVEGATLVSTGDADATDAYAGLFLLAVEAAYRAAPDDVRLAARASAIRKAVDAIRSTQRPDGLTGAKPGWMVAYLMNEAEAFAGLDAGARLATVLGDDALTRDAARAARRIRQAVRDLWNPRTESLDWAVHQNGARQETTWAQLYPDAVSQVWAVRYGLLDGEHAETVLTQFLRAHPDALDPQALDLVDGRIVPAGYWTGVGPVLGAVDATMPGRALMGTSAVATASARAWPYSVQTAADLIRLAAGDPTGG